jgi:hypothetical protein
MIVINTLTYFIIIIIAYYGKMVFAKMMQRLRIF